MSIATLHRLHRATKQANPDAQAAIEHAEHALALLRTDALFDADGEAQCAAEADEAWQPFAAAVAARVGAQLGRAE